MQKHLKILYISGSLGLGHVTRDIAIARELRKKIPGVEIKWLASHPANIVLENAGEEILPEAKDYANENEIAENNSKGFNLNLFNYSMKSKKAWIQNVKVYAKIARSQHFDLIIGDETYELVVAFRKYPELKKSPFVMIYDFVGPLAMTKNPYEIFGTYMWNLIWSYDYRKKKVPPYDLALFVGELQDVPDKSFGFLLPNRRKFAEKMYKPVGYILPFEKSKLPDKTLLRTKLGYRNETLIIVSIGGTSIGKEILELSKGAFYIVKNRLPSVHMVLVTGPRINTDLPARNGIEIKPFIPKLYEHFAACDLAIIQGGATSAIELAALNKPFIYFPIENHFEQANVARLLNKRKIGLEMKFSKTTPELLAQMIMQEIGKKVTNELPVDGARKAAKLINQLII